MFFIFNKGWVGSSYFSIEYFCALPAALFVDFLGPRYVSLTCAVFIIAGTLLSTLVNKILLYILTVSVLSAFGEVCISFKKRFHSKRKKFVLSVLKALVNAAYYAILPHYFNKRLGLATGLMNCGSSIITTVSPFLAAYLLKEFGLKRYFLVTGCICMILLPISLVYRPVLPQEKFKSAKVRFKDSFKIEILKNPRFILWVVSTAFWQYGSVIVYQTIVSCLFWFSF